MTLSAERLRDFLELTSRRRPHANFEWREFRMMAEELLSLRGKVRDLEAELEHEQSTHEHTHGEYLKVKKQVDDLARAADVIVGGEIEQKRAISTLVVSALDLDALRLAIRRACR